MSTAGYAKDGMTASAALLALGGIAALFAPAELLAMVSAPPALVPFVQILGALYLGFAIANWTAKDSVIGGIYGRALALGNLVHFLVGVLSIIRAPMVNGTVKAGFIAFYAIFAVFFGWLVFFASPGSQAQKTSGS